MKFPEPLISARNISKSFTAGREVIEAVNDVCIDIFPGDFITLTGPSGSGKSVLLNLLGLLEAPDGGMITFKGRNALQISDDERSYLRNQKIGMIFQRPWMVERLSVVENIALPLRYRAVDAGTALAKARATLETVGLLNRADDRPRNLSGGQLQLVALARVLLAAPEIILADEPVAALDTKSKERAMLLLRRTNRAEGTAVVLVTQDAPANLPTDRLIGMEGGQLRHAGPDQSSRRMSAGMLA